MYRTLTSSWPIFFGLALIMVGNGLQGTLLGVRATIEGFDTAVIGLIMSLYYLGFLAGSYYVPKLISKVGHIRVFTALASMASATVLIHGLYPDPWLWGGVRVFTGFGYAGLYIVVESWLNNMATNKTRGKILALYQIVTYLGLVGGQFLLNFADPATINLFVITSILVSLALLPISLSSRPAPDFEEPDHIGLKKLFKISPLGLAGAFVVGLGSATIFGIGAVYATNIGLSLSQVSIFLAVYIFGGVAFQIPIGWFSDRYDRRIVILVLSFLTCLVSFGCYFSTESIYLLYLFMFALGGVSLSIYGQCLAHTSDHLEPKQYVAAISSLILINGVGAAIGPFLISLGMSFIGSYVFFIIIGTAFGVFLVYGIYRTRARDAVPMDEQGDSLTMPARPSPIVMTITEESNQVLKDMDRDESK